MDDDNTQSADVTEMVEVNAEVEREMALLMRASLLAVAESLVTMRAAVLAMVGVLERRYDIPSKKHR